MSFSFGFGCEEGATDDGASAEAAVREAGCVTTVEMPADVALAETLVEAKWETVSVPSIRLRKRILQSKQVQAPYASDLRASDLIPGVYEGGFKLWECAVDLSRFLAEMPEVRSGSTM